MMRKFAQFLRGSVRVEVTGAAPERLLNALAGRDVRFWQGECVDALTLRLGLYTRDLPLARSLAARCQCELKVLRERGVPLVRRRLARRIALLVTAVVCFALLAAGSLFVWDIDVEGNESVSTGEILRALAGCGVERAALEADGPAIVQAALGDLCTPSNPRQVTGEELRGLLRDLA